MFGSVPGPEFDQLNTQYSGDGHRIVARGKREGKDIVGVFDSETRRRLDAFPPFEEILEAYGGQTGARVAIETNQRAIELREVASDAPLIRINLESPLHRWRFSSGDERLVTVDEAGTLP